MPSISEIRPASKPDPGGGAWNFLGMPVLIHSPAMLKILEVVQRIAPTQAAVLVTGESGTGKEAIARAIHHFSLRHSRPFVDINCGALPENLIESELFGHEKGAFSGALHSKQGMFEMAQGGSLFLDEIAELAPHLQVKLLRVLDGSPYYRLGGTRKVSVDTRIIAATNQDLAALMAKGAFRSDVFHRLRQFHIAIPPLRERPEDIRALAKFFLSRENPKLTFAEETLESLCACPWPGNVRELHNAVIGLAAMADSARISSADLPPDLRPKPERPHSARLDDIERDTIHEVLTATGGHHQRAAVALGISRRTLSRKLKRSPNR